MPPVSTLKSTESLIESTWDRMIGLKIKRTLEELGDSIARALGAGVGIEIYEGIGLNGYKSVFCEYTVQQFPFRLYLELITEPAKRPELFIIDFNIPAEFRGRGLGSRIICALLGIVSGLHVRVVMLNPASTRARNFWRKFGFKEKGKSTMELSLENDQYHSRCAGLLLRNVSELTA